MTTALSALGGASRQSLATARASLDSVLRLYRSLIRLRSQAISLRSLLLLIHLRRFDVQSLMDRVMQRRNPNLRRIYLENPSQLAR